MTIREQIEELERRVLSEHAQLACETRGRASPEPECAIRTVFQRDRDRIIHKCKAFRRLANKTQVFISPQLDHYRTRLSHTLEVSQIARTISKALRLNEDLTEAISLAHDVGHTPFGHHGEAVLDELYSQYGGHFHHHEHSLRVVDVLENDGKGLNLTFEVRDGILSHTKGREDLQEAAAKVHPATLEGQVVRISDRIAYLNHDLDDAIRAGLLELDDVPADLLKALGRSHGERLDTLVSVVIHTSEGQPEVLLSPAITKACDDLKDFLFERVYDAEKSRLNLHSKVKYIITGLFRYYLDGPWDDADFPESIRSAPDIESRTRAIVDYIAGMTDRFAKREFARRYMPEDWPE